MNADNSNSLHMKSPDSDESNSMDDQPIRGALPTMSTSFKVKKME